MSREETKTGSDKVYYQVVDGTFRTKARITDTDFIERTNKNNKVVRERVVDCLTGMIEGIAFEPSDFGLQLQITLDANPDGKHPVMSFGAETSNGREILRKLPSIDLTKEVSFAPYKFTPEGEVDPRYGITITQGEQKIQNFFWDKEKEQYQNGHPTIDWDAAPKSEQKIFLIKRDEFLVNYTKEYVIPKIGATFAKEAPEKKMIENSGEISPDDIPFK